MFSHSDVGQLRCWAPAYFNLCLQRLCSLSECRMGWLGWDLEADKVKFMQSVSLAVSLDLGLNLFGPLWNPLLSPGSGRSRHRSHWKQASWKDRSLTYCMWPWTETGKAYAHRDRIWPSFSGYEQTAWDRIGQRSLHRIRREMDFTGGTRSYLFI